MCEHVSRYHVNYVHCGCTRTVSLLKPWIKKIIYVYIIAANFLMKITPEVLGPGPAQTGL